MVKLKKIGQLLAKKQVGIPLLVVATALITATAVLALTGNGQGAGQNTTEQKLSVKGDSTRTEPLAAGQNDENKQGAAAAASNNTSTASKPKAGTTQGAQTTPKPGGSTSQTPSNPATPTLQTPKPAQPTASIVFSADGCFVTLTGAPGWTLTGAAETGFDEDDVNKEHPRRGGPLIDPAYVMTANGPVRVQVGFSGFSQAEWRLTASLSDGAGNVMTTKRVYIEPAAGATCP